MDLPWIDIKDLWNPATGVGAVALALVVLAGSWALSAFLTRIIRRSQWLMNRLGRHMEETALRYAIRVKTVLIFLAGGLIYASLIPGLRGLLGTLVAGAGITAVVVGFAAKSTLANFVSGLTLAIYRPIRIGDKVTIEDEYGTVEDITLRHTILRTWENKRLIIPNEKMDNISILNHSIIDPSNLLRVEFSVSYDTDLDLARRLILEEAVHCPGLMWPPKAADDPWVRVVAWQDFSIEMRLYAWVANMDDYWQARWWLLEAVKKRFDAEGVEIPFPYRTVVYKKDLPEPPREAPPPQA